ncbi:MAG: sigma-70 family RNA polymerase sigma factor [Phycisphaeraceae bacterium]|nr:sigma-70 family RNA polymerase sigma factor [Phycisphaeraceae bacterium]
MNDDDRQLLIRTRRGDQAAARSLWHRHAPRLVAYAATVIRGTGNRDDAEDTVQAVFCRVMALDPREIGAVLDPGAWLAQLTRRSALNWVRSARRASARVARVADGMRGARGAAGERGGASEHAAMGQAVDSLPARLREVVVLRHIAGLTFDQIETATGVNRNTAAARYRVAVERLRAALLAGGAAGGGLGGDGAAAGAAGGTSSHRQRMVQHV